MTSSTTTTQTTKGPTTTVLVPVPDVMPLPASIPDSCVIDVSSTPTSTSDILGIVSEKTLMESSSALQEIKKAPPRFSPTKATSQEEDCTLCPDDYDGDDAAFGKETIPLTFPDGGFGWAVVFGAFMIQFCRFGLRPVIAAGIFISGSGMIMASFAQNVWQLYLSQGLMFGFGAGMALFNSVAIPVQWFDKKRGLASGITVAGSGLGGATLASLNRWIISRAGYKWALRTMGISSITIVLSVLFCIRARIPPRKRGGPLLDVSMFKDRGFTLMYLMGMLVTFGYLVPVFLLPKFAVDLGLTPEVGSSLVSIFAGVNAVSRILLGFVADWYGPLNVLILSSVFSGLACLILWTNTQGLAMAIVFVVIYGANAGGFNSLFPVVAADVIGVEKLAAAVGLLYSGNFFGNLLGTPLASAIIVASGGSYTGTMIFAGSAPILGAVLLLLIRFKDEKRIFVKM
ncbi:hypothetical protein BGZ65_003812 [Modicella reniformis]|uniref:Major facilitator superfamily (MFS) profile domain-containing protein n=1 Tax=Modicella reniformis TaxID=1440133 RepID=A0A9P6MHX9_9FUNG|nr:hypothetical protein BGZ65_003812 [Modicella reniformis]